jgi:hypothetical protein
MRNIFIVFILFLSLVNIAFAQEKEPVSEGKELEVHDPIRGHYLPALDNPKCFRWSVSIFGEIDWSNPESLMSEISLHPLCDEFPNVDNPSKNYYIFSFTDSLTIDTYDRNAKEFKRSISYKIERNKDFGFLIYVSDSRVIELYPNSIYDDHYDISTRYRIPMNVAGGNVWLASGVDNTENCTKFRNNKLLALYSTGLMDFVVMNKVYSQFQIFTFGEKLVVETYDRIKDEVIKTEEFEYTTKADDSYTLLVHFSNFSAEFKAFGTGNTARHKYFIVECVN